MSKPQKFQYFSHVDNIGVVGCFNSKELAIEDVKSTIKKSARAGNHGFVIAEPGSNLVWEIWENGDDVEDDQ